MEIAKHHIAEPERWRRKVNTKIQSSNVCPSQWSSPCAPIPLKAPVFANLRNLENKATICAQFLLPLSRFPKYEIECEHRPRENCVDQTLKVYHKGLWGWGNPDLADKPLQPQQRWSVLQCNYSTVKQNHIIWKYWEDNMRNFLFSLCVSLFFSPSA